VQFVVNGCAKENTVTVITVINVQQILYYRVAVN